MTETGDEDKDNADHQLSPPAVTERETGGAEDTDRGTAMHAQEASIIAQLSAGRLTDGFAKDIDAWTPAVNESVIATGRGNSTEHQKVTTHHATFRLQCMTTGVATKGSGRIPTGEKAAGVSTNEGGVEPGPIAHHPR